MLEGRDKEWRDEIGGEKKEMNLGEGKGKKVRTALPVANFFSVPMMAPVRWAWFRAPFPRTTVSRWEPPPLVLLPIFVTVSQSSMVGICFIYLF